MLESSTVKGTLITVPSHTSSYGVFPGSSCMLFGNLRETSSPGLGNGIRCLSSETVVDGQGQKASWTVSLVYVLYSVNVDSVPLY
jgi:hypothetical protein